jgi:hypothetical protein
MRSNRHGVVAVNSKLPHVQLTEILLLNQRRETWISEESEEENLVHGRRKRMVQFMPSLG